MSKNNSDDMAKYITPLLVNGLSGRMLKLPSANPKKKREILLIYGQHASIERMYTLGKELSLYGPVTLPDLPGFGGMDSLYKIGEKPDIDTMADYLATVMKLCYRNKKVSIIGVSYGFIVATRMLQKYPELNGKVNLLVSLVGFTHHEDFSFSPSVLRLSRFTTRLLSSRVSSWIVQHVFLRAPFIAATYFIVADRHAKLKDGNTKERWQRIKFEIKLWQSNDIRTYMHSINGLLHLNLCNGARINLPMAHVHVADDQYFDSYKVEQHMRVIFDDYRQFNAVLGAHMPTIVATQEEIAPLLPKELRQLLDS